MPESELRVTFLGVDKLSSVANKIATPFTKLGGAIKTGLKVGVTAMAGAGAAAVGLGAKFVDMGSDAEEMLGKFNVVFAETGGKVTAQLQHFADEVGRSTFELQGMASTFGDTLKPMGFTEEAAANMAVQLSKLAVDLGSFNDMPMDEALRRLQGTLIGSHENALAFGVIINENTLKAELAAQGWDKLTGSALEQAKVQARINLLMAGTTDAQGDAARTSGSWANQMRALTSTLKDGATNIGLKLLPVVTPLLTKLTSFAREAIPRLVQRFVEWMPKIIELRDRFIGLAQGGLSRFSEWMSVWGPKIKVFVAENLARIRFWIDENKPKIVAFVAEAFGKISNWIAINKPKIVAFVTEALQKIRGWLDENGPKILAFIDNQIEPLVEAFTDAGNNIKDFLIVQFEKITTWYNDNKPLIDEFAIKVVDSITWLRVEFIKFTDVIIPLLDGLITTILNVGTFIMQVATGDWAGAWQSMKAIGQSALDAIKGFFTGLAGWVTGWFGTTWSNVVAQWQGIWTNVQRIPELVVDKLIEKFGFLGQILAGLILPPWMMPGSPTPWETGLRGVSRAMQELSSRELPQLEASLQGVNRVVQDNRSTTINRIFNVQTSASSIDDVERADSAYNMGWV